MDIVFAIHAFKWELVDEVWDSLLSFDFSSSSSFNEFIFLDCGHTRCIQDNRGDNGGRKSLFKN